MDKEKAKFTLQCYRPDEVDASDLEFAEALDLAINDEELSLWLIKERAFDAEFAEALAHVKLPCGLRERVLLAMAKTEVSSEVKPVEVDDLFISALATLSTPPDLREKCLLVIQPEQKIITSQFAWKKLGVPLAAAAGIAMAFFVATPIGQPQPTAYKNSTKTIPISAIQASFTENYGTKDFRLDQRGRDKSQLVTFLKAKGLPCGSCGVPPGLEGVDCYGCKEIVIDGKHGSLICFKHENGGVHLVIFRKTDVSCRTPSIEEPRLSQSGDWNVAAWETNDFSYSLISKIDQETLSRLF